MELKILFWSIVTITPLLGSGIFFAFFPYKAIQLQAKLQRSMSRNIRMSDENIDQLTNYSSFFRVNYAERLKSKIETPEKHRLLAIWIRIMGFAILLLTFFGIWLLLLAAKTGYL